MLAPLEIEGPHGWIQWKGTEVCMDIHCGCGELTHVDGTFCYYVQCCKCGRIYECDGAIRIREVEAVPPEWDGMVQMTSDEKNWNGGERKGWGGGENNFCEEIAGENKNQK